MRGQRERVPSTYRDTGARRPAICNLWDTGSRNLPPCSDRSECSDTCGFHPGTRRYLRKHRHDSQDVKSQNTTQQIFQTVLFGENTTVTALLHKHIISDVKQTTTVISRFCRDRGGVNSLRPSLQDCNSRSVTESLIDYVIT